MLLKYFYHSPLAHASYMVGCQATGEAIIIDPGRDIEPYLAAAQSQDMRIVGATETHIHADFLSGARALAERTGARLYLSAEGGKDWSYQYVEAYDHRLLKDGDSFKIGNILFEVIHTPGHTPEHISLLLTDTAGADRPMGIFSGDFVFVGDVGRPDLLEKAAGEAGSAETGARQMFESLQRFKTLPDYLQVWPAHGAGSACGKALGAIPSSTVGYEKLFNAALSFEAPEPFIRALLEGQPEPPKYFAMMKRLNKQGPAVLDQFPLPQSLPLKRLVELLASKSGPVIDTRPAEEFAGGHIPGVINIPYNGDFTTWAGWLLDYKRPFYLIAGEGQIEALTRDLFYIGLDNIAGYFPTDVIEVWPQNGRELQSYARVSPQAIAEQVKQGQVMVLDVRALNEWQEGHIPGAKHIMLGYLPERLREALADKPILVQCLAGARSAIGASILQANGFAEVLNLEGGYRAWAAAGLPVSHDGD